MDGRIAQTYAKRSTATSQRTLYDSYLRAFRWATDRIGDTGIVAFVSNGGWIDGNTADGIRLSLADEYSRIYVYNLRGNQRTAGELSRKEGGKVFGSGSRNTVAILIGVKDPAHTGDCEILYRDIGDYLTREDKLKIVDDGDLATIEWQTITPNSHGDWVSQRDDEFTTWPAIGDKKSKSGAPTVFATYSLGLATGRDAWCYNSSRTRLIANVKTMIATYEDARPEFRAYCQTNNITRPVEADVDRFLGECPQFAQLELISWNRNAKQDLARNREYSFSPDAVAASSYRPFFQQHSYFHRDMNAMLYQLRAMFPTPHHKNIGFWASSKGSSADFTVLATTSIPDLVLAGAGNPGQFFSRWIFERSVAGDGELDLPGENVSVVDEHGYRRVDNITDAIHALYQAAAGEQVTKDDIFFYVYGLLHDPAYRETYATDLKKMLPHIPTPESRVRFAKIATAGRLLAELHVGFETVEPYDLDVQIKSGASIEDRETWRVQKMKWGKKKDPATGKNVDDRTTIIYNPKVTITGIPEEAERYMLGSRSALAWIIDRYQVKTDKASGIVNDPNIWCDEHENPTYIVDQIKRVTTVALKTTKIVDSL